MGRGDTKGRLRRLSSNTTCCLLKASKAAMMSGANHVRAKRRARIGASHTTSTVRRSSHRTNNRSTRTAQMTKQAGRSSTRQESQTVAVPSLGKRHQVRSREGKTCFTRSTMQALALQILVRSTWVESSLLHRPLSKKHRLMRTLELAPLKPAVDKALSAALSRRPLLRTEPVA